MTRTRMRVATIALMFALLGSYPTHAFVVLFTSQGWDVSVGAPELNGFAGADLQPTVESPADVSSVRLLTTSAWRIDVAMSRVSWPDALAVSVRTTSESTSGSGSTSAATTYLALGEASTLLASGDTGGSFLVIVSLGLQYLIEGISVEMGAGTHTATIVYTVTDQ